MFIMRIPLVNVQVELNIICVVPRQRLGRGVEVAAAELLLVPSAPVDPARSPFEPAFWVLVVHELDVVEGLLGAFGS